MFHRKAAVLSLACLGLALSLPGIAAETDRWEFEVTPYLLGAGMDGTTGTRGVTTDVDSSFSDILDNLDAGFMGLFTAQKGPWSFGVEAIYMKLESDGSKSVTGPLGRVTVKGALDVTSTMYVGQASVGYRVLDDRTKLDLVGALRYTKLEVDLDVAIDTADIVFPGGARSASGSDSWVDGVVGVRVLHPVSETVSLLGYADVGAGGSDLTYQFIGGLNWEFRKDFVAKVGYRYMYWDYESGGNVWDMSASGPYLGLGIRF